LAHTKEAFPPRFDCINVTAAPVVGSVTGPITVGQVVVHTVGDAAVVAVHKADTGDSKEISPLYLLIKEAGGGPPPPVIFVM
jgi:hypothetical protein